MKCLPTLYEILKLAVISRYIRR